MSQTKVSAKQSNAAFFGLLEAGNVKQAADMVTDFTRVKIRESSFFEKLLPAVKIGDDELTPQLNTDKNVKLVEREPNSPAAITIPLGAQPVQYYFRGDRYPVYFDRIVTPKFTKDISELRTYGMDIRQVISDNAILDMDFEFDKKMLTAIQTIIGSADSTVSETGVIQNKTIVDSAGITRSSLMDLKKILPRRGRWRSERVDVRRRLPAEEAAGHELGCYEQDGAGCQQRVLPVRLARVPRQVVRP